MCFQVSKLNKMDEIDYNMVCGQSSEDNIILQNSTSISINNCSNYTNHTDSFTESEFSVYFNLYCLYQ